jgi:hypothetical protein
MNDQLTPEERAMMRARLVGGARDIKPVGAHRGAVIAGSIAAALVIAIAGGVAATTTLSAPEIATTPSPAPTESTPTPSPTSTPEPIVTPTQAAPTTPVLAFGGDCSAVLSESAVSALVGVPMESSPGLPVWDATFLGGVSCQWRAQDTSQWQALNVTVLPWSLVPEAVRARAGVTPSCEGGPCDYSQRFGDAWVVVNADDADIAVRAAAEIGPRAAASPGIERQLPSGAWKLTDCQEQLADAVSGALGRDDLGPIGTDNVPMGQEWDVLTASGFADWCSFAPVTYDEVTPPGLRIGIAAGARFDASEVEAFGGTPVEVDGAQQAWVIEEPSLTALRLVADAPGGLIDVTASNLTEEQVRTVAAAVLAALG